VQKGVKAKDKNKNQCSRHVTSEEQRFFVFAV